MDLAAHQRKLLGLFRYTHQARPDDDAYTQRVARSKDLEEARGNILLWRVWVLERTAALTFTLLKRRNLVHETVGAFIKGHNISPFRETQAPAFLAALSRHPDSLIAAVAQFELALLKVRHGDPGFYVVRWDVEPHTILNSLARDLPLEDEVPEGAYEIHVSRELPSQFQIVCVSGKGAPPARNAGSDAPMRRVAVDC
jgi:hypothetical protein